MFSSWSLGHGKLPKNAISESTILHQSELVLVILHNIRFMVGVAQLHDDSTFFQSLLASE